LTKLKLKLTEQKVKRR